MMHRFELRGGSTIRRLDCYVSTCELRLFVHVQMSPRFDWTGAVSEVITVFLEFISSL